MKNLATREHRVAACFVNALVGMLPLTLPEMLTPNLKERLGGSELLTGVMVLILGLIQLVFVWKMQGSPGTVFVGLRVQRTDGSVPGIRTVLGRAAAHLTLLVLTILMPDHGGSSAVVIVGGILVLGVSVFLVWSAIVVSIWGRHSLIDRLTDTEVVKIAAAR